MKYILSIILCMFLLTSCGYVKDNHVWIAGTSLENIKKAELKDYGKMGVGAASSFLTHELAHIVLIKSFGSSFDIKNNIFNPQIIYDGKNLSNNQKRWIERAGLLSQNLVGLFLPKNSYFTMGYNLNSAVQTITYPIREGMDLNELDKYGGNADLEWSIYSLISIHNLLRIEW